MKEKKKILHVCILDKFIPPFIQFLDQEFADFSSKHFIIVKGDRVRYPIGGYANAIHCKSGKVNRIFAFLRIGKYMHKADKIILHGLFDQDIVRLLALMPWLAKKCYWVMWGGDLYAYSRKRKKIREHIDEFMRRLVISRIGHLVTYIKGDYQLAEKWYGATGKYHECLMYTSNTFDERIAKNAGSNLAANGTTNILVGNSADPSNNHIEALEKLLPYRNQDINIFVPLSYGDEAHARYVEDIGRRWFGEKFFPLTEFMPFDDYIKLLGGIEIAIFNHNRQQAMGNTITLLGLGKKIFMRNDVSQWDFLRDLDIIVFDINDLNINKLDSACSSDNMYKVQKFFSKETLKNQLSSIFD